MIGIVILCFAIFIFVFHEMYRYLLGTTSKKSYLSEYINIKDKRRKDDDVLKHYTYHMNRVEYLKISLPIAIILFISSMIFFRSFLSATVFSLCGFIYPRYKLNKKRNKRKALLGYQFKEAMYSIANSLKAGLSLQKAIERCLDDLLNIYKNSLEKPIVDELRIVVYEIRIGISVSEALVNFQKRVELEDVDNFVNAAILTEKMGGNLTEVIQNVTETISDKIQIKREIKTLTAGKKAEAKILSIMPICLVALLTAISPSYMKPMYDHLVGRIMMVICLLLLGLNYIIGKKITNINI